MKQEEINILQEKAKVLMKKEGTYTPFLRHSKRGNTKKMQSMMEDLINRHGQGLENKD